MVSGIRFVPQSENRLPSHSEIGGDNPCSRHLSGKRSSFRYSTPSFCELSPKYSTSGDVFESFRHDVNAPNNSHDLIPFARFQFRESSHDQPALPLLGWLVHDCVTDFERTLGSTHKFDDKSIWGSSQTEIGGDNPCYQQLSENISFGLSICFSFGQFPRLA